MRRLLNLVVSICLALFVIGSSVIITLNIRDIYYKDIDKLNKAIENSDFEIGSFEKEPKVQTKSI